MEEDYDPFAVFGGGSDSEDEIQDEEMKATSLSRSMLVEHTNSKLNSSRLNNMPGRNDVIDEIPESGADEVVLDLSHFELLELPWPKPLFQGPITLVSSVMEYGGGRGFIASRRLPPGTLVLIEEPIMTWPDEQLGKKLDLISVEHLLERPEAQDLVANMEWFHPEKRVVDEGTGSEEQITKMMEMLRSQCTDERIDRLLELATKRNLTSRDSSPLSTTDIVRILLALRYNGLESGVYLFVAMLNHSCHPNCTKFLPVTKSFSEVRTTRVVEAGEMLTISYAPRILSHASRRHLLWSHHKFDIGANLKGNQRTLELLGKSFPPSSTQFFDDKTITARIENSIEEMESISRQLTEEVSSGMANSNQAWETLKALELATLELCNESTRQLNSERHILLVPCLQLHIEITHLVQSAPSNSVATQLGILSRQVQSIQKLLPLQHLLFGKDHFDSGKYNLDLSNAIRELLIRSPKCLIDLNIPGLKDARDWSGLEHKSRKESCRIQALYPRDAESLVEEAQAVSSKK